MKKMKFEKAKWIWVNKETAQDEYGEFYTEFNYNGGKLDLLISADSNYAVYMNGELCAFGQYSDYPYDRVYDVVDVSKNAKAGKNSLAVVVWYYGIETSQVYYVGTPSLIFELFENDSSVVWSCEDVCSRFSKAYVPHMKKIITPQMGLSFAYDSTKEDSWKLGDGSDFERSCLVDIKAPLRPRPNKKLELLPSVEGKFVKAINPTKLVFDLGINTVGFVKIDTKSSKDQSLMISYGEHIEDGTVRRLLGGRDFSVEVKVKKGETSYMNPFRRLGCRYLEVESEIPLESVSVSVLPTVYPLTEKPKPAGLSDTEKAIYDICVRTLRLCMHEHYEDCPWREQALYCMDSRNQMLCGYYAFGEYEFPRSNLELIAKDDRKDKLLSICYPSSRNMTIPSFSLHYFTECREYLEHSGDVEFLKEIYPKLLSVLSAFTDRMKNDEDLVVPFAENSAWNFNEWRKNLDGYPISDKKTDPDLIINTLLSLAMQSMAKISDAIGVENNFKEKAEKLNKSILREFYLEEKGLFCDRKKPESFSVLGNSLAILSGAAATLDKEALCNRLLSDTSITPVSLSMQCFFYDALLSVNKEKYSEFIISDIESKYVPMVEFGVGTVWETELGEKDFGNAGSLCHGWSALPIYYYHLLKA